MNDANNDKLELQGIMSSGYGIIPKSIMKDKQLTIEAKSIYAYLSSYAGGGDSAFPSVELICFDLGISQNRFHKHRKLLEERGYIEITRNRKEIGFSNNIYKLLQVVSLQNVGIQNVGIQNVGIQNLSIENLPIGNEGTNNNSLNNNSLNNNSLNNNSINNTTKSKSLKTTPSVSESQLKTDFDAIWINYPNKKGKSKAYIAYKKAIKAGVKNEEIQTGVKKYASEVNNKRTDPEFIAHGSTWFNQKRWEDDYETGNSPDDMSWLDTESLFGGYGG